MNDIEWLIQMLEAENDKLWGAIRVLIRRTGSADPVDALVGNLTCSPNTYLQLQGRELRRALAGEQAIYDASRTVPLPRKRPKKRRRQA